MISKLGLLLLLAGTQFVGSQTEVSFVPLFDGETLAGWTGEAKKHFAIEAGVLVCQKGCAGNLLTVREYSDFILRFDFKLTPGANNGIAIRVPKQGDAHIEGLELQILDNTAEKYRGLKPYQFHGSVYGIAPAKRDALRPVGEWNSQEVRCLGSNIQVILNCKTILNIDLEKVAPNGKTMDGLDHPGLRRREGHLGFLCHDDLVQFRNIRIKELKSSK